MQTQFNVSVQPPNNGSHAAVLSFFERRPCHPRSLFFCLSDCFDIFGFTAKAVFPQYQPDYVALIAMSVVIVLSPSSRMVEGGGI